MYLHSQASAGVRQLLLKVRGALPTNEEAAPNAIEDNDDDKDDEDEEEKEEKTGKTTTTNTMTSSVVVNHDDGKDDEDDDADDNNNSKGDMSSSSSSSSSSGVTYDPSAREPKGAGASGSALWELALLSRHFHPSVQAFARSLVDPTSGHTITYAGDPLVDFALMPFLDKIVFKQAKASGAVRPGAARMGGSKHSQALAAAASSQRGDKNSGGLRGLSVQSTEFLELDASAVPPDHQFFHRFFVAKEALNQRRLGRGGSSSSILPGAAAKAAGAGASGRTAFGMQEESDDDDEGANGLLGEGKGKKKEKKGASKGRKDDDDDDVDDDEDIDDDHDEGDGEAYEQGLSVKEAQALLDGDETDEEERAFADGNLRNDCEDRRERENRKNSQHACITPRKKHIAAEILL